MRIAGVIVVRTGREQEASAPITACTKEKNEKKTKQKRGNLGAVAAEIFELSTPQVPIYIV